MRVIVRGQEIEVYTIGETARLLKKSVETIRAWEREQIIPKPLYKKGKVRLYHPHEVDAMKKVLRKVGKHCRKETLQKEIWKAVKQARDEITETQNTDKSTRETG